MSVACVGEQDEFGNGLNFVYAYKMYVVPRSLYCRCCVYLEVVE